MRLGIPVISSATTLLTLEHHPKGVCPQGPNALTYVNLGAIVDLMTSVSPVKRNKRGKPMGKWYQACGRSLGHWPAMPFRCPLILPGSGASHGTLIGRHVSPWPHDDKVRSSILEGVPLHFPNLG